MIKGIKFASIPVRDQDRALAFWRDQVGLAVATDQRMGTQRWIELRIPGADTRLVLFTPDGHENRIGADQNVVFWTHDVEKTWKALSAKGVTFTGPPKKEPWGTSRSFRIRTGTASCWGRSNEGVGKALFQRPLSSRRPGRLAAHAAVFDPLERAATVHLPRGSAPARGAPQLRPIAEAERDLTGAHDLEPLESALQEAKQWRQPLRLPGIDRALGAVGLTVAKGRRDAHFRRGLEGPRLDAHRRRLDAEPRDMVRVERPPVTVG
jgi:predicted enzyme related to lactoylglutathione lyase